MPRLLRSVYFVLCLLLVGCGSGGAVRFAPTPLPPDQTPAVYTHPSGAFRVTVPLAWSVYERHATTLAAAAFSASGEHTPWVRLAALRLETPPENAAAVNTLLDTYQTTVRPDAGRYNEQSREAMGDGSWRLTGTRRRAGGAVQTVNTFIEFEDDLLGLVEVVLPEDTTQHARLQGIVNTFALQPDATLDAAALDALAFATTGQLEPLNVHGWTSAQGAFFITGEVANYTDRVLTEVPVRAVLTTADGRAIAEATDTVMGQGVPPGRFAPFSLRFGEGQPPLSARYRLMLGGDNWTPDPDAALIGEDVLDWTDTSELTEDGWLVVSGEVTNTSADTYAYLPMVTVTVFDDQQRIIGAGTSEIEDVEIAPGETVPYRQVLPELGGFPSRYIVTVQARP